MSERKAFLLRVDPRIHDALRRWAEEELRSVNGQAEVILRDALRRAGRLPATEQPPADSQPEPPRTEAPNPEPENGPS